MSAADIATYIAIALPVGGFFTWVLRHYLAELKPNGGESMNDYVKLQILPLLKEMRQDQIQIKTDVSKLEGKFEQHIIEHVKE
jgi:hypothetical protein